MLIAAAAIIWSTWIKPAPSGRLQSAGGRSIPIPPKPLALPVATLQGSRDAKVGLLIYGDFECPYCGKFAREVLPAMRERYVSTGELIIAFSHVATERHKLAAPAAAAAICAEAQGSFWLMHDELFRVPGGLKNALEAAPSFVTNKEAFNSCRNDANTDLRITAETDAARSLGVSGTPTFFFGAVESGPSLRVTKIITGAQPLTAFSGAISEISR